MKRILLVLIVMIMFATPAYAQSGCERAHECGEELAWANPTGQPGTPIYAYDPVAGYAHQTGLYGLVAFCQLYDGYYYLANDGAWYWFAC